MGTIRDEGERGREEMEDKGEEEREGRGEVGRELGAQRGEGEGGGFLPWPFQTHHV